MAVVYVVCSTNYIDSSLLLSVLIVIVDEGDTYFLASKFRGIVFYHKEAIVKQDP
jgi:hypothetical protein